MVSTAVLKVDPVLDFFPSTSLCFWGVRSNRGGTLLSLARSRCSFRLSDESPAVLVTNQILWNICFSQVLSECFPSLWVEIFPFAHHVVDKSHHVASLNGFIFVFQFPFLVPGDVSIDFHFFSIKVVPWPSLFLVRCPRFRFRWDWEILIPSLVLRMPRVWACNRRRRSNIE